MDAKTKQNRTLHQIVIGDARRMRRVADESVHLVVTSPPYWQLKDYGDKN
ncbi:MAG: site-specific DNA-methyltransferase, partial [Gammaproteobacteria bacterium]|nr:site-specific DNA-methyltransferase [Gammaproteobacteria bacterium]